MSGRDITGEPVAGPEGRADALLLHPRDNVAVALRALAPGEICRVGDAAGECRIAVSESVPFCHKLAIAPVAEGEPVWKFGEIMGRASAALAPGMHVHIHNVESCRGRGAAAAEGGSTGAVTTAPTQ